jgi:hypothetical protein
MCSTKSGTQCADVARLMQVHVADRLGILPAGTLALPQ